MNKMIEIIDIVKGGKLIKNFDYSVNKKHWFYTVVTDIAPDVETMKILYDSGMRVSYDLCAKSDGSRYTIYTINHRRIEDYEWTDGKPIE